MARPTSLIYLKNRIEDGNTKYCYSIYGGNSSKPSKQATKLQSLENEHKHLDFI